MQVAEGTEADDVETTSNSSSSDAESDFEVAEVSNEDAKLLETLRVTLQENSVTLATHLQYISLLRRCKLKEQLRAARKRAQEQFSLPEAVWLEWISDEIEDATGNTDLANLQELFELALNDYLSVDVWALYIEVVRDTSEGEQGKDSAYWHNIRALCERAVAAGGLHLLEGHRLWELYRDVESESLQKDPVHAQVERLRALFARQLETPLQHNAESLAAYLDWERSLPPGEQLPALAEQLQEKCTVASTAATARLPLEEAISAASAQSEGALLRAYLDYARFEKANGNSMRVQCIFERAIAALPASLELWLHYLSYVEEHLNLPSIVLSTHTRAVRNCPHSGLLWARFLAASERAGKAADEHATLFARAQSAKLSTAADLLAVCLARCDYVRRTAAEEDMEALRAVFNSCASALHECFPASTEQRIQLMAYWSDYEVHYGGGAAAARNMWEKEVRAELRSLPQAWAAYIGMEVATSNFSKARALYHRFAALSLAPDSAWDDVLKSWVRFERQHGGAEDELRARLKCEHVLGVGFAEAASSPEQQPGSNVGRALMPSKEELLQMRRSRDPNFQREAQRSRMRGKQGPQHKQDRALPQRRDHSTSSRAQAQPRQLSATHAHIAYVKGIGPQVTDAELADVFKPCGGFKEARVPKDRASGDNRGFAYVEFENRLNLEAALAKKGTVLHGQALVVLESNPPKGGVKRPAEEHQEGQSKRPRDETMTAGAAAANGRQQKPLPKVPAAFVPRNVMASKRKTNIVINP